MSIIKRFISKENEPVRRYIYGVTVAVVALLVVLGFITNQVGLSIGGVATALFLIPTTEVVRNRVTPNAKVPAVKDGAVGE